MSPLLLSAISSGWSCVSVSQIFTPLPKTYNNWYSSFFYLVSSFLQTEINVHFRSSSHQNKGKIPNIHSFIHSYIYIYIHIYSETVLKYSPHVHRTSILYIFICGHSLTFWHRSFTFNSNKSPTWCNSFSVYYPEVCLQLNMFWVFSRPSSGAQWLQWQPLVLPSYCGDSRAVFVVGPAGQNTKTARISPR
jgi:hypothetical protein